MAISLLIALCGIAVFFQPDLRRFYIAFIYFMTISIHDLFLSGLTGLLYYGSAAIFDLLAIALINIVSPICKKSIFIANICFASIFINMIGWIFWYFYFPPFIYNVCFVFIYMSAAVVLLWKDKKDVGVGAFYDWNILFYHNIVSKLMHYIGFHSKI